ncbi:hypothetical protein NLY39_03565 [Pseudomonas sp. KHPS1]|uniref:hypothetical protein n=1 Tax=Pseudomonas putida TaxID=303 RepID=UPI0020B7E45D|nr:MULTISPECIES: hypothetical protein [Pseudomonas]MDD2003612.1 hypothetical protein [Pseudomonas putida]UTH37252.1 hypothetical protein NLY39_03565 [Pseudomonas sp. KHPS1]
MTRRKTKRPAPISYRPPERLREEFHTRVRNSRQSVNAFITEAVFGQAAPRSRPMSSLDQKMVAMLLSQAARINDRLEQACKSSVDGNHSPLLQECRDELAEIRSYLMLVLGREP